MAYHSKLSTQSTKSTRSLAKGRFIGCHTTGWSELLHWYWRLTLRIEEIEFRICDIVESLMMCYSYSDRVDGFIPYAQSLATGEVRRNEFELSIWL